MYNPKRQLKKYNKKGIDNFSNESSSLTDCYLWLVPCTPW